MKVIKPGRAQKGWGSIEEAIAKGEITKDEIIGAFAKGIRDRKV